MKLAVVTPRYGPDIAGGAETAARLLATELAARTEWAVEALTTTAHDAATWQSNGAAATELLDGVAVHRFPVTGERVGRFRCRHRPRRAAGTADINCGARRVDREAGAGRTRPYRRDRRDRR